MSKDDGGAAFPVVEFIEPHGDRIWPQTGMSLRDYFAIHAPEPDRESISSAQERDRMRNPYNDGPPKPPRRGELEIKTQLRYEYADTMLIERAK